MAKYGITIEKDGIKRCISSEKVTVTSDGINVVVFCEEAYDPGLTIPSLQNGNYKYDPTKRKWIHKDELNSLYSRAQVLREEWIPEKPDFYYIDDKNEIHSDLYLKYSSLGRISETGFAFAPTRELAEEIVQIHKGEWKPKVGDRVWQCANSKYCKGEYYIVANQDCIWDDDCSTEYIIPFPSGKQRDAFIEKNKPQQEKCDHLESPFDYDCNVCGYKHRKKSQLTASEQVVQEAVRRIKEIIINQYKLKEEKTFSNIDICNRLENLQDACKRMLEFFEK